SARYVLGQRNARIVALSKNRTKTGLFPRFSPHAPLRETYRATRDRGPHRRLPPKSSVQTKRSSSPATSPHARRDRAPFHASGSGPRRTTPPPLPARPPASRTLRYVAVRPIPRPLGSPTAQWFSPTGHDPTCGASKPPRVHTNVFPPPDAWSLAPSAAC